jgi:HD-GYP domain-containing protein (c-di-GMP phosphodiesterase class II)
MKYGECLPVDELAQDSRKSVDASMQLDAIFRAFPDLLFTMDEWGTIIDYRAGKPSSLYMPPEKFLGRSMRDVLPKEVGARFEQALHEIFKSDKVVTLEYQLQVPEGMRWFEARLVPLDKTRAIAIVRDATERVDTSNKIQNQLKRLSALHAVDAAMTSSFDLNVTLSVILRQSIAQLGVDAADILVLNSNTHLLEFAAGQGFESKKPQPLPVMIGQGFAGKAALERRTITVPDLKNHLADLTMPTHYVREKSANYCAVPLIAKGQVRGVLELYYHSMFQADNDWLDFLATIAGQAAVAIDSTYLFQDLQRTNVELSLAYDAVIESWAQILELSNRETGSHAYRVMDLTLQLAHAMGIADDKLVHYRRGALLHDVGKLGISEIILNKPGPLDDIERGIIQQHPMLAYHLLLPIDYLAPALDIPHYHHEHWDGSGYPDGLREEQIPFSARLFAVVDVYDALVSDRPYRRAWSYEMALEYLHQQSGKLFDPKVVEVFTRIFRN